MNRRDMARPCYRMQTYKLPQVIELLQSELVLIQVFSVEEMWINYLGEEQTISSNVKLSQWMFLLG